MTDYLLGLALGLIVGYQSGVLREWRRVDAYLDANEDQEVWWLRIGITANNHHRRDLRDVPERDPQ